MSGKPNPEGVKTLKQSLYEFYWTRDRIAELKVSIAQKERDREKYEVELRGLKTLIDEKLSQMDVSSPGNCGWEQRFMELLLLFSQL